MRTALRPLAYQKLRLCEISLPHLQYTFFPWRAFFLHSSFDNDIRDVYQMLFSSCMRGTPLDSSSAYRILLSIFTKLTLSSVESFHMLAQLSHHVFADLRTTTTHHTMGDVETQKVTILLTCTTGIIPLGTHEPHASGSRSQITSAKVPSLHFSLPSWPDHPRMKPPPHHLFSSFFVVYALL